MRYCEKCAGKLSPCFKGLKAKISGAGLRVRVTLSRSGLDSPGRLPGVICETGAVRAG